MSNDISIINLDSNKMSLKVNSKIDENSKFDNIFTKLNETHSKKIYLNCSELNYINSAGIRSFIDLIQNLAKKVDSIFYIECSTIIISQFNMVKGFFPENVTVKSFYCPYFNPATDEEKKVLVFSKDIQSNSIPSVKDEDGNELEFDGFIDKYFQFLNLKQ